MKIAVMAGTPIDSQLGEDLLKKYGYKDIVKIPISKNPVEQTTFQALDDTEREDIIVEIINKIKEAMLTFGLDEGIGWEPKYKIEFDF